MTISSILSSLDAAEDSDDAFIIAAAINLYSESIRRKLGRILYGPEDVKNLLVIAQMLLNPPAAQAQAQHGRSQVPSSVEKDLVLDPTSRLNRV